MNRFTSKAAYPQGKFYWSTQWQGLPLRSFHFQYHSQHQSPASNQHFNARSVRDVLLSFLSHFHLVSFCFFISIFSCVFVVVFYHFTSGRTSTDGRHQNWFTAWQGRSAERLEELSKHRQTRGTFKTQTRAQQTLVTWSQKGSGRLLPSKVQNNLCSTRPMLILL